MTVVKVREDRERADPSAWYVHPRAQVADRASPGELRAAGVDPNRAPEQDG